jgi:hypothetical protein
MVLSSENTYDVFNRFPENSCKLSFMRYRDLGDGKINDGNYHPYLSHLYLKAFPKMSFYIA